MVVKCEVGNYDPDAYSRGSEDIDLWVQCSASSTDKERNASSTVEVLAKTLEVEARKTTGPKAIEVSPAYAAFLQTFLRKI